RSEPRRFAHDGDRGGRERAPPSEPAGRTGHADTRPLRPTWEGADQARSDRRRRTRDAAPRSGGDRPRVGRSRERRVSVRAVPRWFGEEGRLDAAVAGRSDATVEPRRSAP